MNSVIAWVVVIVLVVIGAFVWDGISAKKDCENRALVAAVDTYPIDQYPNITERTNLQQTYKQTYIQQNCR